MKHIEVNGKPIRDGETVTVDHFEQLFVVKLRSLGTVHPDMLKRHIQDKWEVTECDQVDTVAYVVGSNCPDL